MIFAPIALALAAAVVPASNSDRQPLLSAAGRAIEAGRFEQARLIIAKSIAAGDQGQDIERLLADLAFASGSNAEAFARYERLIAAGAPRARDTENAGLAALKLGKVDQALQLISAVLEKPDATWRAWNARGVIADLQQDWATADAAYDHASGIAPAQAEIINNYGWSQALRGNWKVAIEHFERAFKVQPQSERIANNLELAQIALVSDLPRRRRGESNESWAERLNDAGVVAQGGGDRAKAVAAFTQALEANGRWYQRAARNLDAATHQ